MDDGIDRRPFGSIVNEALEKFASLIRLDLRLLEAEMKSKTSTIVSSGACGIAAVALFVLASFAMVQFLILVMIHLGISPIVACLAVGIVLFGGGLLSLHLARLMHGDRLSAACMAIWPPLGCILTSLVGRRR
ncbi:phage holin family protein [Mesorhizobium sophorae]|uniref:phage holin family protein n=1 Tax=Mesorhizobium sophorae TaxID=1300294 RepID=UPI000BA30174|nr:phage holin family protein [Mesorhizobium sophorae]